jgi:hypothetical protein
MRRLLTCLSCILFTVAPFFAEVVSAAGQIKYKDDDQLSSCGTILQEILEFLMTFRRTCSTRQIASLSFRLS